MPTSANFAEDAINNNDRQEAHHKVGLGETPLRLIRKRCRYSSLDKFREDAFDAAVPLSFLPYLAPFPSYKTFFLHFGPVLRTFL